MEYFSTDALVGNRNISSKNVQEKILSTFLTEMDGVGTKIESLSINNMTETGSQNEVNVVLCLGLE